MFNFAKLFKKSAADPFLDKSQEFVSQFFSGLETSNLDKKELKEMRDRVEEGLTERVLGFILNNLSGEQLDNFEDLVTKQKPNQKDLQDFITTNIDNFFLKLEADLLRYQEEIIHGLK